LPAPGIASRRETQGRAYTPPTPESHDPRDFIVDDQEI
jgi:hypothetical protein